MRQAFTIQGRLTGVNEYVRACRTSPYKAAAMKRSDQDAVCWAIKAARLAPFEKPVFIKYTFYEAPKRKGARLRDKSNIAGQAVKVIEDALQETGIIKDDDWDHVAGYSASFYRATDNPRIVVEIWEVEQ